MKPPRKTPAAKKRAAAPVDAHPAADASALNGNANSPAPKSTRAAKSAVSATAAATPSPPMARVAMAVRWDDLDAFNHVNNATFLVYAQEARLAWLAEVKGSWFDETMMPVVAAAQMNYRRQLAWPAQIAVELAATRIGTSSLTISHRIVADNDPACVYADGEVVMVWVDPVNGRSVPLPQAIRSACTVA